MNFQRNRTFNFQLGTRHLCCDGYQYETKPQTNGGRGYAELLFFPTAEGYVKALYHPDVSHHEPKEYQYIYIYKDHLGNNRLSYTFDPETEQVKILEEKHYYRSVGVSATDGTYYTLNINTKKNTFKKFRIFTLYCLNMLSYPK